MAPHAEKNNPLIVPSKESGWPAPLSKFSPIQMLLLGTVLILFVAVAGLVFYLYQSQRKPLRPPVTPLPEVTRDNLESCSVKKEGNPLVNDVKALPDGTIVGNFRGNINKVELTDDRKFTSLEVVSPRGDQNHTFRVREEDGLVYDVTSGKNLKLTDLAPGQTVFMSFDCFPQKSGQFKITRISITGRL